MELKVPMLIHTFRVRIKLEIVKMSYLRDGVDVAADNTVVPDRGPLADHDLTNYRTNEHIISHIVPYLPRVEFGATQQFSVRGRRS